MSINSVRFLLEKKLQPLGVIVPMDGSPALTKLVRAKSTLALTYRVPIMSESLVQGLAIFFRPLFRPPVILAMLAGLVALDLWLFFVHGIGQSLQGLLYQPEIFLVVSGLTALSVLFHELGHATACHYGGARPGKIGMGIYLVWPVFYNDVTDTYRLGRIGRLRTDLGGVYFDIIFSVAVAGAYFLTGFEPLLFVIFIQQWQILYQFMPFIRLDGYYVISDLTGVPDLFSRIKPVLKSMIPGREMDKRVEELKQWVRVVVTTWVVLTIPLLLGLFSVLIINAPLAYASTWESFWVHYDKVQSAFGDGLMVGGAVGLIQIVLLAIPVVGMTVGITLAFAVIGRRLGIAAWNYSKRAVP